MDEVLEGESESLGILSIVIPEETIRETSLEDRELDPSQHTEIQSNGPRNLQSDIFENRIDPPSDQPSKPSEPISPPASSSSSRQSPDDNFRQSYSPDHGPYCRRNHTPEPDTRERDNSLEPEILGRSDDTSPERDVDIISIPRAPRQSNRPPSSPKRQQNPASRLPYSRNHILTGSNTIQCPTQPQDSSPPIPSRNNRRPSGMKRSSPRFRRFQGNNQRIPEHSQGSFRLRGRDLSRVELPIRHINTFTKQYDSYRPEPTTRSDGRSEGQSLLGRIGGGGSGGVAGGGGGCRRRRKIPRLERRE